jgi:hypothetical protein
MSNRPAQFFWYTSSLDTLMTSYFLKRVQLMVRSREENNCGNRPYHELRKVCWAHRPILSMIISEYLVQVLNLHEGNNDTERIRYTRKLN